MQTDRAKRLAEELAKARETGPEAMRRFVEKQRELAAEEFKRQKMARGECIEIGCDNPVADGYDYCHSCLEKLKQSCDKLPPPPKREKCSRPDCNRLAVPGYKLCSHHLDYYREYRKKEREERALTGKKPPARKPKRKRFNR